MRGRRAGRRKEENNNGDGIEEMRETVQRGGREQLANESRGRLRQGPPARKDEWRREGINNTTATHSQTCTLRARAHPNPFLSVISLTNERTALARSRAASRVSGFSFQLPAMNGRRAAIMVRAVRRLAVLLLLLLTTGLLLRRVVWGINAEVGTASMATARRQRGLIILWESERGGGASEKGQSRASQPA